MANLWVALLLLLATLSSHPLGSMEQSAAAPEGRISYASALPLARALDDAPVLLAHEEPLPQPQELQLATTGGAAAVFESFHHRAHRPTDPTRSDPFSSFLERLPYFATAPPEAPSI